MTRRDKYLVFLSHSARDTWVAKQIASHIQRAGATVFLDEAAIEIGADFEREILDSLNRAHELVVLLTPWALDRPYVWAELGVAWGRRIQIVGLLHGLNASDVQGKPGIPVFLKQRNLILLNDTEKYLQQLARRCRGGVR